jgi:hypothetical protein
MGYARDVVELLFRNSKEQIETVD